MASDMANRISDGEQVRARAAASRLPHAPGLYAFLVDDPAC